MSLQEDMQALIEYQWAALGKQHKLIKSMHEYILELELEVKVGHHRAVSDEEEAAIDAAIDN